MSKKGQDKHGQTIAPAIRFAKNKSQRAEQNDCNAKNLPDSFIYCLVKGTRRFLDPKGQRQAKYGDPQQVKQERGGICHAQRLWKSPQPGNPNQGEQGHCPVERREYHLRIDQSLPGQSADDKQEQLQAQHNAEANDRPPGLREIAGAQGLNSPLQCTGNGKHQYYVIDEITRWGGKECKDLSQKLTHNGPPAQL